MKLTKFFPFVFLLFCSISFAQTIDIKGAVSDSKSNSPLPGVSVVVKNSTVGTTTDFDGNYSIRVSPNDVLVFSYLGFKTFEVAVQSTQTLNVVLQEDVESLEEVVVVGYGTQKKSVVTGSISSVKAADLENIPNGRVEQALQGRTSGVVIAANSGQPGSASTVRVRGITTFNGGGNNPLWVVDGIIVDNGAIGFVNQSDISSIEVLKDAASLAIYGARSASGVILITTKKGKEGKINVNYNVFTGVSEPAKKIKLLNATEYGALLNEKAVASGQNVLFPDLSVLGKGTDWQKQIFNESAQRVTHEVSLSGGSEKSNYFASFGLTDQEGMVATKISNYNKKNIRLNSNHIISKYVKVGQTLGYSHQKSVGIGNTNSEFGGVLSSAINLDPITPVIETDPAIINASPFNSNPVIRDKNGNPFGISTLVGQEMTNPLAFIETRLGNFNWSDDFVGSAFIDITPIEGLTIRSVLGTKLAYWGSENFTPEFFLNPSVRAQQNSLSRTNNRSFGWNIENTITYSRTVLEDHNFTILLGQSVTKDNDIFNGTGVTHLDIPTNDYRKASFNFSIPEDKKTSFAFDGIEHRVTSLFARLNYDYKEKYLFTGVIRRDGSSRFGDNNKYGTFPSFSVGWNVNKEDFWKENKYVNSLKIRGGYGVTGNDAIGDFRFLSTTSGGRNYTFGDGEDLIIGNSPNAPANPDLEWEETSQTSIGFDARILNDFSLTFDYFNKETTGILQEIDIPGFIGSTGSPVGNVADMENRGVELELGYQKRFNEFNLSVKGNISFLENEVTNLGQGKEFITTGTAGFQSMGPITRTQVGHAFNSFYGFKTDGIFQTVDEVNAYANSQGGLIQPNAKPGDFRWKDNNGDGRITDDDKQFLGSSLPKYTFGFTINMDYKGFDLMIFAQGAIDNQIFQGLRRLDIANANYQVEALGRWHGAGTSNTFPRLVNNDSNGNFTRPSDFYLENGDYLRFKVVQVGYTIPNHLISKFGVQKFRVYVTGENLLTITDYTGFDPEIGGNVLGIDRGFYPQARSFIIGANLQF